MIRTTASILATFYFLAYVFHCSYHPLLMSLEQTVDFSEAERKGYVTAFVDHYDEREDNTLSRTALTKIAQDSLKGCRTHFGRGVVRISNISAAVNVHDTEIFRREAMKLLDLNDPEHLVHAVGEIVQRWPATASFFEWWTSKEHAAMLFPAVQQHKRALFDRLQDTTNAGESMHNKIYRGCGATPTRKPHFTPIEGCRALINFCEYFAAQFAFASSTPNLQLIT
jgi:hypothetical protein